MGKLVRRVCKKASTMGKTLKTRFLPLFLTLKNQKVSFYQLKLVHELIEDPLSENIQKQASADFTTSKF